MYGVALSLSGVSLSNSIPLKSIRVRADLIAYLCLRAITIILRLCAMDQKTRSSSSLISSKIAWETRETTNNRLHPKQIEKSSLFQLLFFRYFRKPSSFTLAKKSRVMVTFSKSSTIINVGLSATTKPSTAVVIIRTQQVIKSAI